MIKSVERLKYPNNLRKLRKQSGKTQEDIGKVWGVERADVSRIENGLVGITPEKRRKLLLAFGWTASQLLDELEENIRIPIVGYIGAGAKIYPIDDYEPGAAMEDVEAPPRDPQISQENMVAVIVRGDSMLPVLRDGWIVYYNLRHRGGCDDLLNSLAIVSVRDGPTYVKELKRGSIAGMYNLDSYNAAQIENIEIEWCAKIIFIRPK